MFKFKTKRARLLTAFAFAVVLTAALFYLAQIKGSFGEMTGLQIALFGTLLVIFILSVFAFAYSFSNSSAEEDKKEDEKKLREEVTENAKIVAEAIIKNYPRRLQDFSELAEVVYKRNLNENVLAAALHRVNHDYCPLFNEVSHCEENSREVSESIRLTLAILAKRFEDAGNAQKAHQKFIDERAEFIKGGKEKNLSAEEVERLFKKQEGFDMWTDEVKKRFWEVHSAAKAIGEKVYPKIGWYLLLWHPGLECPSKPE